MVANMITGFSGKITRLGALPSIPFRDTNLGGIQFNNNLFDDNNKFNLEAPKTPKNNAKFSWQKVKNKDDDGDDIHNNEHVDDVYA